MSFMPTNSVMHLIWQLVALTLINTMYPKCCVQDLRPFWSVCLENSAVGSSSESWAPRGRQVHSHEHSCWLQGKRACMHREGMFQNLVSVYQCLAFFLYLSSYLSRIPSFCRETGMKGQILVTDALVTSALSGKCRVISCKMTCYCQNLTTERQWWCVSVCVRWEVFSHML